MPVEVKTADCSSLSDAEVAEMADIGAQIRPAGAASSFDVGDLSKQLEEWVLVCRAFSKGKLHGFVLSTLERIGGTPALLIGVGVLAESKQTQAVCRALVHQQYHKALMAFPDEDVVVSTRITDTSGFVVHQKLSGVRPWPDVRPTGEDRAWGRRLAKRYGATDFDDRTMIAKGAEAPISFGCDTAEVDGLSDVFANCDVADNGYVLAWGWAMAEFLEKFAVPK